MEPGIRRAPSLMCAWRIPIAMVGIFSAATDYADAADTELEPGGCRAPISLSASRIYRTVVRSTAARKPSGVMFSTTCSPACTVGVWVRPAAMARLVWTVTNSR